MSFLPKHSLYATYRWGRGLACWGKGDFLPTKRPAQITGEEILNVVMQHDMVDDLHIEMPDFSTNGSISGG